MALAFSPQAEQEIEALLKTHLTRESCSIPTLWIAQREFGWISAEVKDLIAARLKISRQLVEGVATFYTMFHRKAPGKHHFQVCRTISCALYDAGGMSAYLERRLETPLGETRADGRYSLTEVECLGSCGTAPVLMVNETYYESVTPEALDALIDKIEKDEAKKPR